MSFRESRTLGSIVWLRCIAAAFAAFVMGCAADGEIGMCKDQANTECGPKALANRPCPPDSQLTYENFAAAFFSNHCTGCHSSELPAAQRQLAPVGVDLDTRTAARFHLEGIYNRAADDNDSMPPSGGPTAIERKELGDWLACGAN